MLSCLSPLTCCEHQGGCAGAVAAIPLQRAPASSQSQAVGCGPSSVENRDAALSGSFAEHRRELQPLLLVSEHHGPPWPEQLEPNCSEPEASPEQGLEAATPPAGSCVSAGPEPAGRGVCVVKTLPDGGHRLHMGCSFVCAVGFHTCSSTAAQDMPAPSFSMQSGVPQ